MMRKKILYEQEDQTQINTEFDKKPGMSSYASSGKGAGSGEDMPKQEITKSKKQMKLPVDLEDARSLKDPNDSSKFACPLLQGTQKWGPADGSQLVLRKEATEDRSGFYSTGDILYFKNDGTYDVYSKAGKFIGGKKWFCAALSEQPIDQPKPPGPKPQQKLNDDQLSIVKGLVTNKGLQEACNDITPGISTTETCASLYEIGIGSFYESDLSTQYPKFFNEGVKKLYKRRQSTQKVNKSEIDSYINSLKDLGWKTFEEIQGKSDEWEYMFRDLSKLRPDLFTVETPMYVKGYRTDCSDLLKKMSGEQGKINFGDPNRKDCKETIDTLYFIYKNGCNMDPALKDKYVTTAKTCKQKNFRKGIDKMIDELTNISKNDPDLRKRSFSLAESVTKKTLQESIHEKLKEINQLRQSSNNRIKSIKTSIHENLLHIKEQKRINFLEEQIMKSRVDFVAESFKKNKDQDKFLRDVIYEFNYMSKQNFGKSVLNESSSSENLLNYLSKKVPNAPNLLVNKLVKRIAVKMDGKQDSWWVDKVVSEFMNDSDLSVNKILEFDCSYIVSKFSKAFKKVLKSKKSASDDVLDSVKNAFDSAIENWFTPDFERDLKSKICPILSTFASKTKDTEEMLNKKLVSKEPSED